MAPRPTPVNIVTRSAAISPSSVNLGSRLSTALLIVLPASDSLIAIPVSGLTTSIANKPTSKGNLPVSWIAFDTIAPACLWPSPSTFFAWAIGWNIFSLANASGSSRKLTGSGLSSATVNCSGKPVPISTGSISLETTLLSISDWGAFNAFKKLLYLSSSDFSESISLSISILDTSSLSTFTWEVFNAFKKLL